MPASCLMAQTSRALCVRIGGVRGLGDPWGYAEPSLKRVHRRLFRLNDKIASLEAEIANASAELEYHRSINDDAQRDAAIGNYIDREEAGATAADVRRFERTIAKLESKRTSLAEKRDQLLRGLGE
jgi:chromosome segregation ATPase